MSLANIEKFKLSLKALILSVFTFICFLVFSNVFCRTKIFLTLYYKCTAKVIILGYLMKRPTALFAVKTSYLTLHSRWAVLKTHYSRHSE